MSNEYPATDFIGRQRELAILTDALDQTLAGRGQIVMMAGEPGIGKTRIAQELAGLAQKRGALVLWGWCYEQEGAPPYWPWVEPVRSYITITQSDQLHAQMGPGAADIAEVIPEVRDSLPDLEPPPALDPNQARFRLFDSFTKFLKNAAQTQPLILVLDDLHWADRPSLLLLEFLARQISEISLMIVGTYRDAEVSPEDPLFRTLAELSRNQSFHRQTLEGLASGEVEEFILVANGARVPQELIDAIYAHTEGNPFFIIEVIRLLVERGELGDGLIDRGTMSLAIPQGVLEVIGQRLSRLSVECNDLLTTAAVIGRQFDFNVLVAVTEGTTESGLVGLVEEALAARVLQELPESRDRYQFSHALTQQTLLERLSTSRRVRLHSRVGEALEALWGDQPGDHSAELAYHFTEAQPVVGTEKLVKYTMLAGERALETYAEEEALEHFQRGLIAKGVDLEGSITVTDSESAALIFGLGRAQAAALGRPGLEMAFASLSRAFDFYVESNDIAQAVNVADYPLPSIPSYRGPVELVARALRLVPPESPEAGRLLSRYVVVLGTDRGDYQKATEAYGSALAIAQSTGDVALEMRTLANSSHADFWQIRWQETVEKGLRAIQIAQQTADKLAELSARFWVGVALACMGESKQAQEHGPAMLSTAEDLRDLYWLATTLWFNEMASFSEGDWRAARYFSERGLSASPSDTRLLATRMQLEFQVGNVIEGQRFEQQLIEALGRITPGPRYDFSSAALKIANVAYITGELGRLHHAKDFAKPVLSAVSPRPLVSRMARFSEGLVAVLRGDVEAAREQYGNLSSASHCYLTGTSSDRILGLLAQTMVELDQAVVHFEDAVELCRDAGYRPELAWSCYDYAGVLLDRNAPGDRAKVVKLINDSIIIATDLGMSPLVGKLTSLKDKMDSEPAKVPAYPDGLTQREIEVLRLISGGKTDREIGEELFISVKTVGNHVSNILNKTSAANRTEAAVYAARQGITADPETD